jgi:hypothetical protein
VTSTASVELLRDSTDTRPTPLVDTLTTAIHLTYQIAGGGLTRQLTGSVDSFTVQSTGLVPAGQQTLAAPITFAAVLSDGRTPTRFQARPDTACAAPDAALLVVARDLLLPVAPSLAPGSVWRDTVTSTVCRAGIPVTLQSVRSYRVVGQAVHDSVPAVQLTRATELTLTGQGIVRDDTIAVSGSGTGSGELFLDRTGGRYLGGTDSSSVEMMVTNGKQTRRFVQRARQETKLEQR